MSCTRSNPPNGYTAENRTSTTLQNRTTSPALERAMVTIAHQDNEPTLYAIKGILILDNDGNRILAKYYDSTLPTTKEQKAFEKNLYTKTHRANDVATTCVVAEIIMLDGMTCVYRSSVDIIFYVIGSCHENELILSTVLGCLHDSVSQILRKNVEKRTLLDSLDIIMLAVDEICDGGIILEADPSAVVQRVALRTDDIPLGEQTVAQVSLIRCSCATTSAFRSPPPSSYLHMIYLCFFVIFFLGLSNAIASKL
ncbi:COPZ1 [Cordylochernes scorpioides]|uniref:Coatomer subunit zeta n=1 Tax=Cordylochernes scorpioides TaxID=51811 RepID=A0ABY6KLZ3_9ARAC|nr:COPZ1 [Cordylochernes scorpioides]